ncbi:MAG: PaeR7I family type II restriction endonuclease [Gemmataceae bacterium]|nr:PaeR7I family type II restriction endonuclease [Gemmataceae bacterium]
MSAFSANMEKHLRKAIRHFWSARLQQASKQGGELAAAKDRGERGAVTGGKQMDGFLFLVHGLLVEAGLTSATVFCRGHPHSTAGLKNRPKVICDPDAPSCTQTELPGWFRAEKDWDLLVVHQKRLIAAIEFKSQVGPSFGNNFNNRTEEALGNATDLWAAYREGAFSPSDRPWLGYLMLLEETHNSTRPVRVSGRHFKVFPEFKDASYAQRYEILLTKLVRERLYDSSCFLMSTREKGSRGGYREPNSELGFQTFTTSLLARAIAAAKTL